MMNERTMKLLMASTAFPMDLVPIKIEAITMDLATNDVYWISGGKLRSLSELTAPAQATGKEE